MSGLFILSSPLSQILAMGKEICTTLQDENVADRALVVHKPPVDRSDGHFETATDQDDSGDLASQCENPSSTVQESHDAAQVNPERSLIPLQSAAVYIDVVVEEKSTLISKHLLCSQSSFFDRALNGSFREAHENRIILEERFEVFQIFHTWLLQGKLSLVEQDPCASVIDLVEQTQLILLEVYIFADRLGIPKLSDDALLQLDKVLRPSGRPGRASVDCIHDAFEFLPESSGLLRYLIALEVDADKSHSPRRTSEDLVDLPELFITKTRPSIVEHENTYVRTRNRPLNLFALSQHVSEYGGYEKVEHLRKWGVICMKMGISLSFQRNVYLLVREMYRSWLGPFDEGIASEERLVLESQCSRPFVKEFFQSPVAPAISEMGLSRLMYAHYL